MPICTTGAGASYPSAPSPPSISSVVAGTFYGSQLIVTLGAVVPTGCKVIYETSTNGSVWTLNAVETAAAASTATLTGLTANTAYYVRAAIVRLSDSAQSAYAYKGGGASPGTTTTTAWDPSANSAVLWDDVEGAALAGRLWQNTGKTIAATADGDPIRVFTDAAGNDWIAPSDAARPTLKIESGVYSMLFDGVNDRLELSGLAALGTSITAAVAIKPTGTGRGDPLTRWLTGSDGADVFDLLMGVTTGKPQFYVRATGIQDSGVGSTTISAGQSVRLVGTAGSGTCAVYLNNVSQSSAAIGTLNNGTQVLCLGANYSTDGYFSGRINAFAVFPSVLNSTNLGNLDVWMAKAQAIDPSVLGSKLKVLSRFVNDTSGNYVYSSADNTTPCSDGDLIQYCQPNFVGSVSASQPTSGNRATYKTDGAQPDTTNDYLTLSSAVNFGTGNFEAFAWGTRVAATAWMPFGGTATGSAAFIWSDGQTYYGTVNNAVYSQIACNPSGRILYWARRVGSVISFNWTGRGSIGTGSNTGDIAAWGTNIDAYFARPALSQYNGSLNNRYEGAILTDELTSDERTALLAWIVSIGGPSL